MKSANRISILTTLGALCGTPGAFAQVVTDGSLGVRTSISGPNYFIAQSYGQQRGGNLFHSFSSFNIAAGQNALFDSNASVTNIVARVTGGSTSTINGSVTANANLFLLNPQGILFGANAALNVNGSFHASTADYLRMSDGARFHANVGASSTLSVAPPAAFGFLDNSVAPIVVQGSYLDVPASYSLSFIGGHLTLVNSQLSVPNGRLNLAAVASAGEVALGANNLGVSGVASFADIQFNRAWVNVDDEEAANVFIRGGRFVMENQSAIFGVTSQAGAARTIDIDVDTLWLRQSGIVTGSTFNGAGTNTTIDARQFDIADDSAVLITAAGVNPGGDIAIRADNLSVSGSLSLVGTATTSGGAAGNVTIDANSITVSGGAISALTGGAGSAGNIDLAANTIRLVDGGGITSATAGSGSGGRVTIEADSLTVDGTSGTLGTGISVASTATSPNAGNAGQIAIDVDALTLRDGFVSSSTGGPGRGGDIAISANTFTLDEGASITTETGIPVQVAPASFGSGGAISIDADSIQILSGSRVSASTFANGSGGTVTLNAERVVIDQMNSAVTTGITASTGSATNSTATGAGGGVVLSISELDMRNGGAISTNTYGSGAAGRIDIAGQDVALSDGALITASSIGQNTNAGRANDISIRSDALTVTSGAQIANSTFGSGAAGRLLITTESLEISDGGSLQASSLVASTNPGAAGDIFINAGDISIDAGNIGARSFSAAVPGNIVLNARNVSLRNGAALTATGSGDGSAGNIVVSAADTLSLDSGSRIVTEALNGSGGNIRLFANDSLIVSDSIVSTSVLGAASNGGNIEIDPIYTILDSGQIIARAVGGNGGNIDLTTRYLIASADSNIDASSALGINGRVEIVGVDVDLNSDIASLPTDFLNAKQWLATPCAARQGGDVSQFVVRGREGPYRAPADFLSGPLMLDANPSQASADNRDVERAAALRTAPLSFAPLCLQSLR